jgi:site-specific recombinase XerD
MVIQHILKRLEGAFAENTLRACRADLNAFDYWCKSQQLTPEPITGAEVADYVAWMALSRTTVTVIAVSKPVYVQVLFFMHQYCHCDSGFKPSF